MHKKVLFTCLLLVVVIIGVNSCIAQAKDIFYLKDGLYIPSNNKCYKVEDKYHIEGMNGNDDGIYVKTKNKTVSEIYLGYGQKYEFLKLVKKNGNLYTVVFGLKPGGQMGDSTVQKDTYVTKVYSETSFSFVEQIYDADIDIRARNFKPIDYKYCGDQHIFDEDEEYYRTHGQPK